MPHNILYRFVSSYRTYEPRRLMSLYTRILVIKLQPKDMLIKSTTGTFTTQRTNYSNFCAMSPRTGLLSNSSLDFRLLSMSPQVLIAFSLRSAHQLNAYICDSHQIGDAATHR